MCERFGLQVGQFSPRTLLLWNHAVIKPTKCGEKDVVKMAAYVAPKPIIIAQDLWSDFYRLYHHFFLSCREKYYFLSEGQKWSAFFILIYSEVSLRDNLAFTATHLVAAKYNFQKCYLVTTEFVQSFRTPLPFP